MVFYLRDYEQYYEGKDATLAVQEALRECRRHPGSTLKLGGGELHFYGKYAFEKEYYISNNDYSKKKIIFPLLGMQDVTVDGEGAQLYFHGLVLPFVIDESANVTLKNFSVDIPHPFFFQAKITAAREDCIELTYDPVEFSLQVEEDKYRFFCKEDGWEIERDNLLCCEFDRESRQPSAYLAPYFASVSKKRDTSFLSGMFRYLKATQLAEDKIRLEGHFGYVHTVGNEWVGTFSNRENPGIFCDCSKDILVQNVTLHATGSMGLICQRCENITMDHLRTVPREGSGRFLSVNADSTHFVNCTGAVRYESCTFMNMLDDAGNIHGNYLKYVKTLDPHTLLLTFGHFQQKGINLYRPGDQIHIVDPVFMGNVKWEKHGEERKKWTVHSSELLSSDYVRLELKEELPEMKEGYTIENFSRMPELYIHNCVTGYNRPRGFLPATWRKTEIIGNTFSNMSHGLHFTGDNNDWFESGPVGDVLVKGNYFKNAAYTGGAAIEIDPHVRDEKAMYHRNIVIEENVFEMHEERFLNGHNVSGLVFKNNRFIRNTSLPAHEKIGDKGIQIRNSEKTELEDAVEE